MSAQQTILRQLRPPYAGNAKIVYGFRRGEPKNYGFTLAVPAGQNVIAPGSGRVELISPLPVQWNYTVPSLRGGATAFRIDHGSGIKTWIHGVTPGATSRLGTVERGDVLGTSTYGEIFFAVEVYGSMGNPSKVNPFFAPRNGYLFGGQAGTIRQAPNIATAFVNTLAQWFEDGIRYFVTPQTFFVNVDFNGTGSKTGLAATGNAADDYWNVVASTAFSASTSYYCGPTAYTYSVNPSIPLQDYRNQPSTAFLRRVVQENFNGSTAEFDAMLSTYLGGYSGMTARETTFDIRGLAAGDYEVFAYANQDSSGSASTFSLAVSGGSPQVKVNLTTTAQNWVENYNYVKFAVTLGRTDYLTLQTLGFLSGLQIKR